MVRRSRTAVVASLLSLAFLGLSLCPCPPAVMAAAPATPSAAAPAASVAAHDCCAPAAGMSASRLCCEGERAPAPSATTSAPAPLVGAFPVALAAGSAAGRAVLAAFVLAPSFAARPPLVLRV